MTSMHLPKLQCFFEDFIQGVSQHISNQLAPSEWQRLLALAQSTPSHDPELQFAAFDSIEGRIRHYAYEEQISPLEILSAPYFYQQLEIIGRIAESPLCYFRESGIYLWSPAPDCDSLCFWLTYPAYPPGWPDDHNGLLQQNEPCLQAPLLIM